MIALPKDILTQRTFIRTGKESLKLFFPPIDNNKAWIKNLFTFKLDSAINLPDLDVDS